MPKSVAGTCQPLTFVTMCSLVFKSCNGKVQENIEGHSHWYLEPFFEVPLCHRSASSVKLHVSSDFSFVDMPGQDWLKSHESRGETPNNFLVKQSSSCTHTGHMLTADNNIRNLVSDPKWDSLDSIWRFFLAARALLFFSGKKTNTKQNKHHSNATDLLWRTASPK